MATARPELPYPLAKTSRIGCNVTVCSHCFNTLVRRIRCNVIYANNVIRIKVAYILRRVN